MTETVNLLVLLQLLFELEVMDVWSGDSSSLKQIFPA